MTVFAVVAGGGTSGHVLPALAIIDALVERGHDRATLLYMGARRGVETTIVPPTGTPSVFDDVVGLQRSLGAWRANLGFFPRLWRARRSAITRFRRDRPAVRNAREVPKPLDSGRSSRIADRRAQHSSPGPGSQPVSLRDAPLPPEPAMSAAPADHYRPDIDGLRAVRGRAA